MELRQRHSLPSLDRVQLPGTRPIQQQFQYRRRQRGLLLRPQRPREKKNSKIGSATGVNCRMKEKSS